MRKAVYFNVFLARFRERACSGGLKYEPCRLAAMRIVEDGRGRLRFSALWLWTLAAFALLLAWDASGMDLVLARLAAGSQGFALRDNRLLAVILHERSRQLAWLLALWLLAGLWWPTGVLRQLSRAARLQWLASVLLSLVLISTLKHFSHTSCPWDLAEFGSTGRYVSHWAWGEADGGPGRCFPAGHASAGFAFLGGYFALRDVSPRRALQCLAIVLSAGLILGLAQQLRGAHFMSHTLWTGWLCWTVAWIADSAVRLLWPPSGKVEFS